MMVFRNEFGIDVYPISNGLRFVVVYGWKFHPGTHTLDLGLGLGLTYTRNIADVGHRRPKEIEIL